MISKRGIDLIVEFGTAVVNSCTEHDFYKTYINYSAELEIAYSRIANYIENLERNQMEIN